MSRLLHFRKQLFVEGTGDAVSSCGHVLRECDTTEDESKVECQNCHRELHREPMKIDVDESDYKFKPKEDF